MIKMCVFSLFLLSNLRLKAESGRLHIAKAEWHACLKNFVHVFNTLVQKNSCPELVLGCTAARYCKARFAVQSNMMSFQIVVGCR